MSRSGVRRRVAVLLAAAALDAIAGDPPDRVHPVAWFGSAARAWERIGGRSTGRAKPAALGLAGALVLPLGAAVIVSRLLDAAPRPLKLPLKVWLLKSTFAVRGLIVAGRRVGSAIESGDLPAGRAALGALVSRDVSVLDRPLLLSAAVESLAENATDSFLAPWLAYAAGGLPAAVAYRAVNTLDAMWGYRTRRYEWFGKSAARLDDLLSYVPATVASRLLLCAGALRGLDWVEGRRTLRTQGAATASPNAGRSMAVMAGLLRVSLQKPGSYRLGDGRALPEPRHLRAAEKVVLDAAVLGLLLCCVLIWAIDAPKDSR